MKKKILILFMIIILTYSVNVYAFDGKGECPNTLEMCSTTTSCPIPGQEKCVAGYYCDSMDGLADCQYAGFSNLHCERAGGTWENNFWGGTACVKTIEGHDYYAAGFEGKVSDTQCEVSGTTYDCFEGYYCAFASTPQGSQFYCAPPDFSQEHCTTAGGTWNGLLEICNLGVETCSDVIQNQDETDVDCGGTICPACIEGQICSIDSDCDTNNCEEDGFGNKVCVSGMPVCTILLHTWASPDELDIIEIPAGIPGKVIFVGDNICEDATIDISVDGFANVVTENGLIFEAITIDSGTVWVALVEFDTSSLASQSLVYTATLHHPDLSTEVINFADALTVTDTCTIIDENACDESTLDPSDPAMVGPPFPDVDCDGIADCVDTWLYGDESNGNPYGSCSTPWDCDLAPWSECYESSQGYGQTRFVRDINVYQEPGCVPPEEICPPPPSFKACIEEEPFPIFNWFNMLLVTMMLISFYAIKIRKI